MELRCSYAREMSKTINSSKVGGQTINKNFQKANFHSRRVSCEMHKTTLGAKLSQNLNFSGLSFFVKILTGNKHLAIPHISVPDIRWIDWKRVKEGGFEGVVFDKDNTLTAPYQSIIWEPLYSSVEECRDVFGDKMAILSNSAGLKQFDPEGEAAETLESKIGVSVIRHSSKKPAGNADALEAFFGCSTKQLVMVGDRYFTDVVYGNRHGMLTIRPSPFSEKEPFVVRQVRTVEDVLVKSWVKSGITFPKHGSVEVPLKMVKDPACW